MKYFSSIALFLAALVAACTPPKKAPAPLVENFGPFAEQRQHMGCTVEIQAFDAPEKTARAAMAAGFAVIAQIEKWARPEWPDSDVARINAAAGEQPVTVHDAIFDMLQASQEVSENSQGGYDITFAGVGRLWHIQDPQNFRIPGDAEIKKALKNVGWRGLRLDAANKTAFLTRKGMRIGLGAIAKGWSAHLALQAMKKAGAPNAIVNPGGNMMVGGSKRAGPWVIGIQHPRKAREATIATLEFRGDLAVNTSGDYERFVMRDGIRYNHILDPHTGRPTDPCQSATIVGPHGGWADALATAVFVQGPDAGLAMLAAHYPDYAALIVDAQGRIRKSPNLAEKAKVVEIEQN